MAFTMSKVDRNVSRKKGLPKNEAFDSQDCLDTLFVINSNYDGGLLRTRNPA